MKLIVRGKKSKSLGYCLTCSTQCNSDCGKQCGAKCSKFKR